MTNEKSFKFKCACEVSYLFKFVSKFADTMTVAKLLILFASFYVFFLTVQSQNQAIYINYMKCNFSEKFFYPNKTCFAKSYNRSYSSISMIATAKGPMYNISVSLNYIIRTNTLLKRIFRQM